MRFILALVFMGLVLALPVFGESLVNEAAADSFQTYNTLDRTRNTTVIQIRGAREGVVKEALKYYRASGLTPKFETPHSVGFESPLGSSDDIRVNKKILGFWRLAWADDGWMDWDLVVPSNRYLKVSLNRKRRHTLAFSGPAAEFLFAAMQKALNQTTEFLEGEFIRCGRNSDVGDGPFCELKFCPVSPAPQK